MKTNFDEKFMHDAIELAKQGKFSTHPNPSVGSVVVKDGEIVGKGFHLRAGLKHAEINALEQAGDRSRGSTLYVTLEPCSFKGRTPACAKAIVNAGVDRVVVGTIDPDPRNSGRGIEILRDAGVKVVTNCLEAETSKLVKGHIKRFLYGRPFVRLKLAMSLDGKTALSDGHSKWITSEKARSDVQKVRAMSSAIVTGVGTILHDDPSLSVRLQDPDFPNRREAMSVERPIYVLDSRLRIPLNSKVLERSSTVLVALEEESKEEESKEQQYENEILYAKKKSGRIDLPIFLTELAKREHSNVLFECGATLAGALVEEKLVDEIILYVAPKFLGNSAKSLLMLPELARMSDYERLEIKDVRKIGDDFRVILSSQDKRAKDD
tara:strand:- start:250 stop:1386 length:1137 start_codon:yes stop_codon:yes gene_type:complete